jgi:hypothetical protein
MLRCRTSLLLPLSTRNPQEQHLRLHVPPSPEKQRNVRLRHVCPSVYPGEPVDRFLRNLVLMTFY